MSELPRTLFLGQGRSAITWYRIALPAMALECDWLGGVGPGDVIAGATGFVRGGGLVVDTRDYDVIVLQLAAGRNWMRQVLRWQAAGITVLYEIDDWMRGVRRNAHHDYREVVDRKAVEAAELVMRACDGVICSTPWLGRRLRSVNPTTFVCRNGIDLKRYDLTRPARKEVAIGWAGATGHRGGFEAWASGIATVMREQAATRFISVGQPFAATFAPEFGEHRTLNVPFALLDTYPATMTLFDVALAPAGKGSFFKGKSDLRWLEASALGIPVIADPGVYPDIEHGVTGFHAETAGEVAEHLRALVTDAGLRERMGAAAKAHVTEHRRIEVAAQAWAQVLTEGIAAEPEPVPVAAG